MSAFIYFLVLLLIVVVSMYIDNRVEYFENQKLNLRNLPVDQSIQIRKKILYDNNKNPFLQENEFLIWNDSLKFRDDISTSTNTYTPNYLEKLLKPFANREKYSDNDFTELKNTEKVDIEKFLAIVDNIMNIFLNAIYYNLFKDPNRPKEIMCPNINMCRVELINKKIVRVRKNRNGLYKWDILIELAIFNKAYSYGILCIVEDQTLTNLRIIGIRSSDNYVFEQNYQRDPQLMITQSAEAPYGGYRKYYKFNENDTVLVENNIENEVSSYLDRQFYKPSGDLNFKSILPDNSSCYGSYGKNKTECENNYDTYYRNKNRGVWDSYCKADSDCPFYMANKNYTNTFGGCTEGICEMPMGIKRLSPRYYDIDSIPLCYNCPDGKIDCCNKQKNPDYMFEGDLLVRKAHDSDLIANGLNIT
jgi:hypothetical protein